MTNGVSRWEAFQQLHKFFVAIIKRLKLWYTLLYIFNPHLHQWWLFPIWWHDNKLKLQRQLGELLSTYSLLLEIGSTLSSKIHYMNGPARLEAHIYLLAHRWQLIFVAYLQYHWVLPLPLDAIAVCFIFSKCKYYLHFDILLLSLSLSLLLNFVICSPAHSAKCTWANGGRIFRQSHVIWKTADSVSP